jgi:hypothetical protein
MRTHQLNKSRKLYRSENTTTRHHSSNPGAEYRWERNRKKVGDELLASARQCIAGRSVAGTTHPCFIF